MNALLLSNCVLSGASENTEESVTLLPLSRVVVKSTATAPLKLALAIAVSIVAQTALVREAEAQRPLYRNVPPTEKTDPTPFHTDPSRHPDFGYYVDLTNAPAATSVQDANNKLNARTAAAILACVRTFSIDPASDSNASEKDYGTIMLARMAYSDYLNPILLHFGPSLRDRTAEGLRTQEPGQTGTEIGDC